MSGWTITFVGDESHVGAFTSREFIEMRSAHWSAKSQIRNDLSGAKLISYLSDSASASTGRLVVVPSILVGGNSFAAVFEGYNIPVISSGADFAKNSSVSLSKTIYSYALNGGK